MESEREKLIAWNQDHINRLIVELMGKDEHPRFYQMMQQERNCELRIRREIEKQLKEV